MNKRAVVRSAFGRTIPCAPVTKPPRAQWCPRQCYRRAMARLEQAAVNTGTAWFQWTRNRISSFWTSYWKQFGVLILGQSLTCYCPISAKGDKTARKASRMWSLYQLSIFSHYPAVSRIIERSLVSHVHWISEIDKCKLMSALFQLMFHIFNTLICPAYSDV